MQFSVFWTLSIWITPFAFVLQVGVEMINGFQEVVSQMFILILFSDLMSLAMIFVDWTSITISSFSVLSNRVLFEISSVMVWFTVVLKSFCTLSVFV